MSYEVTLLVFGILLILVGLLGKVKAKELEVGTSSRTARVVIALLGIVLVIFSFNPDITRSYISTALSEREDGAQGQQQLIEGGAEQASLEEQRQTTKLQGVYTIQQKSNVRYMDAHEGKNDNSVVTRDWQDNDTQRWMLKPLGNGAYTIQQKSNHRYMDAHEKDSKYDYSVVTRNWQNDETQRWIINPVEGKQ